MRFDVLAEPAWALGTDSRLLIALMPFTPPSPDMVANGVRVDLALDLERTRPLAKTADFAVTRRRYPVGQAEGVYEYLLVNEQGYILEGTGTNFYGVREDRLHRRARRVGRHHAPDCVGFAAGVRDSCAPGGAASRRGGRMG